MDGVIDLLRHIPIDFVAQLTLGQILLALIGLPGATMAAIGLWSFLKYSRKRLAQILETYLSQEDDRISRRRKPVLNLIRNAPQTLSEDKRFDVHATIDEALNMFEKGRHKDKLNAEASLRVLLDDLRDIERISRERGDLARKQAATVYLVSGSIAASRSDSKAAIDAFTSVLRLNENDLDAIKYLGEQLLCLALTEVDVQQTHINGAIQRFQQLEQLAGKSEDEAVTKADAIRLQGRAYLRQGSTGTAKTVLEKVITVADTLQEHRRLLAEVHELHGDACRAQKFWDRAGNSYEKSKTFNRLLDDNAAVARLDLKIKKNNERDWNLSLNEEPQLVWEAALAG
jgi:tetratricopeptide (TPR) repeat protein